ncbi:MAG: hypothetical protein JZU63_01710, partial [Rhodoferax sp.]|nr:hypothetical protein [Rhodoferax sp.]
APVTRFSTLRTLLAVTAALDWDLLSIDISNAFLHGKLEDPVYMEQPEGFKVPGKDLVWELRKTLYGLKQSPKEWYKTLRTAPEKLGLVCCEHDQALFKSVAKDGSIVYALVYVDDILMAGK